MKVLLLDENRGFGGAEKHLVALAKQLQAKEALAWVVGRKDSWLRGACLDQGLPFQECGFRNEVDMFSVFGLWKLIKSSQARVVHCIAHRDLVAAALALQLPGAPEAALLKAEHSFPDSNLSPLFRWAYGRCQGVASVSESLNKKTQEALQEMPMQARFSVVPNGIDPGPPPETRELTDPLHLGVLSALREGKGHADFLQAVARWQAQTGRKARISLAGDGPLREKLEALATDLEVACEFMGHCEEPRSYLNSLDLCVLPSHVETFSLVALEALVAGVPLVAADSEGVCELYPQPDKLYPKGDFMALCERLERFAEAAPRYRDEALAMAPQYRQEYSLESMTESYLQLYRELSSTPAGAPAGESVEG